MPNDASAWIFQANPRDWDIDRYIADLRAGQAEPRLNWLVTRHANEISAGDRVFLWRAGSDREAGVVAIARVVEPPADRPDDKPAYRVNAGKFTGDRVRAVLEIERVLDRPVRRPQLNYHDELGEMALLRSPQGTNFPLTHGAVAAIEKLAEGR